MNATQLIDDLGGTAAVARLARVKQPSVSGWKESGSIPEGKLIRLAVVAEARGIAQRVDLVENWAEIWPELVALKAAAHA